MMTYGQNNTIHDVVDGIQVAAVLTNGDLRSEHSECQVTLHSDDGISTQSVSPDAIHSTCAASKIRSPRSPGRSSGSRHQSCSGAVEARSGRTMGWHHRLKETRPSKHVINPQSSPSYYKANNLDKTYDGGDEEMVLIAVECSQLQEDSTGGRINEVIGLQNGTMI